MTAQPHTGQAPRGAGGGSPRVAIYDTTLRDGMQGEGMSLSADEKVRVAHALDSLGVHLIEAGFPASNPKEEALFDLLSRETFETSEVAAFGMTRRRDRGYEVVERNLVRAELALADEVFLTGTAAELTPLREIDDIPIGDGVPGPVTREIQKAYLGTVRGTGERWSHWLDYAARTPAGA